MTQHHLEFAIGYPTMVELLRERASQQANQRAFTFLADGETESDWLTYADFDQRSRAIAAQLQALNLQGERALLLYPPGLDYLTAFFGCLYAGVVAVPAYPPRNARNTPRILSMVQDAEAAIALTTSSLVDKIQSLLSEHTALDSLQWLTTDQLPKHLANDWQEPQLDKDTLAFLQYTSGSTGTPKGVMVSHGNLLHNAATTYQYMGHSPESVFVSWLPAYHDMGLIGGILQPLYGGFPCVLMPPATFLQRPYRWLQAISRYKATTSGGPNFAYDLCAQKITLEQRQTLDLSNWQVAFNGAEPVRGETLKAFAETFAECGFRPEAFYPCYGMAEATLMVSGGSPGIAPPIKTVQAIALEQDQILEATPDTEDTRLLVGCGQSIPDQTVAIAHPQNLTSCAEGQVGEVWVTGPSVGQGYWNRLEETQATFGAYLADTVAGPFLRTGDLGFLQEGELFITGRVKDLIIIRGRNLYPQDIERTAEQSHPSLKIGAGAAFTVEVNQEERLVVVQELEFRQQPDMEKVAGAIRGAIAQAFEVQVYAVVLLKPGHIPKTTSGKIQRRACRADFLAGSLAAAGSSIIDVIHDDSAANELTRADLLAIASTERQAVLEVELQRQVAAVVGVRPDQINPEQPLNTLGIDSIMAVTLKNDLEINLRVTISAIDFLDDVSLTELTQQILAQLEEGGERSHSILKRDAIADTYFLSFAQQRLWFVHQIEPDSPFYNLPVAIQLTGALSVPVLEQSLQAIAQRHEILRTRFMAQGGQPVQIIESGLPFQLAIVDCTSFNDPETELRSLLQSEASRPFDLEQYPLWRVQLLRLSDTHHVLLLAFHHTIADGWSMTRVLIEELAVHYEAIQLGQDPALPELPIQYVDFALWQRQQWQTGAFQLHQTYWQQQLEGLPVLQLPTTYPRPAVPSFRGDKLAFTLSADQTTALKALSQREGVTLFMTLLAAFKVLLYRYSGQTDLLVGSPIANRNQPALENLMGCFVNTIVLRTELSGNPSFQELLKRVRRVALDAYLHQDLPFDQLVQQLHSDRDISRNPLFQTWFSLQNMPASSLEFAGLSLESLDVDTGTSQFDLSLDMEERHGTLMGWVEYSTDLFDQSAIARFVEHFQTLLASILQAPDQSLATLPILPSAERQQLLVDWNSGTHDLPQLSFQKQFEQQAIATPDMPALVDAETSLTYRELNERVNQLTHYLQSLGVTKDTFVGVCLERSPELIISILAILKAGGAYVPLDPNYPEERLLFMLEDAQVAILLTQQDITLPVPPTLQRINLDTSWTEIAQYPITSPICAATEDDLAYLIYTSGSTGKPKGVMIERRSLTHFVDSAIQIYEIKSGDQVLQFASISFDVAVEEIFSTLAAGATLVLRTGSMLESMASFLQHCRHQAITVLNLPTAFWHQLVHALSTATLTLPESLRLVMIGSEKALPDSVHLWKQYANSQIRLVNAYGPTETTVTATYCDIAGPRAVPFDHEVPIGRSLPNVQLYVLDAHQQPVPIGIPGELYIGGVGVARGYLNRPDLTNERFIPNPFKDLPRPSYSSLLYKTGDRVRYRTDGHLEFLGRVDHQVKIRGFRIEVGEIEATLAQHPNVQEALVLAREDQPGQVRLVAYVVLVNSHPETQQELRDFLKQRLPAYMLPAAYVILDAFPLTPNGKVDRQSLPEPEGDRPTLQVNYVAPQNELEQAIAGIWQAALAVEQVGIDDNFFELGGHSLLVIQVQHALQSSLKREIAVIDLFKYPTVRSLTQYLNQQDIPTDLQPVYDRAQRRKAALQDRRASRSARR
ncbi:non-ribosomal peptide synthetase [Trichocoleus sp. FACHB-262]|uniref:non-ribosomal peptide synthetase n=1 Tax=Trichocoleus sp. FACHB-262 TaxID=2692869 RepID=UPI0028C4AAC4|nr:non-ribosomal peptide synthetase [Trichocoleus sp. FACHB-262]